MTITVLIENHKDRNTIREEHGISLHVEHNGVHTLMDTGRSGAFVDNASELGIDIAAVDHLVISHGHNDHTGGIERFFEANASAPVYLAPGAHEEKYSLKRTIPQFIGTDRGVLEPHADRLSYVSEPTELRGGVLVSPIPERPDPEPVGNGHLYVLRSEGRIPDPFDDERFVLIEHADGAVLLTGCSHAGIVNIVREAQRRLGNTPLTHVIGGFHLVGESEERIREIAQQLQDIPHIYTGHCTGTEAYEILRAELGSRVRYASGGSQFTV